MDDHDYNAHIDYVAYQPNKHGFVSKVSDWPYSTFHQYVEQGVYPKGWAGGVDIELDYDDWLCSELHKLTHSMQA